MPAAIKPQTPGALFLFHGSQYITAVEQLTQCELS